LVLVLDLGERGRTGRDGGDRACCLGEGRRVGDRLVVDLGGEEGSCGCGKCCYRSRLRESYGRRLRDWACTLGRSRVH